MAMTLAVPVIRNEQNRSLSLDLGVTADNSASLDCCRIRALHSFERNLYKLTFKE